MALLYILTGKDAIDDVMRNLDLNYMDKSKYGEHIGQTQKKPFDKDVPIASDDRVIHVLAHGNIHSIADMSGEDFAKHLLDTFGKAQLSNRKILIYACNIAEGGNSVLEAITRHLKAKNVKKTTLVGSVDQTFTRSTGTMMVLKQSKDADKLSKDVEHERGAKRDKLAEPFLRDFRHGWNGYKINGDGDISGMTASEAGQEIQDFG